MAAHSRNGLYFMLGLQLLIGVLTQENQLISESLEAENGTTTTTTLSTTSPITVVTPKNAECGTLYDSLCVQLRCRCPAEVNTETQKTDVDCSSSPVSELPCWNNTLQDPRRFQYPLSVSLQHCSFQKIHEINSTDAIEALSFAGNDIEEIGDNAFQGLINLKFLSLANNKLDKIGHKDFRTNLAQNLPLEVLDLSNNIIVHIDDDAFEQLENLRDLRLSDNPIRNLDSSTINALNGLQNLLVLRLRNTELTELPTTTLINPLRSLFELDLSYNLLKTVPDALQNANQLKKLSLDGNLMEELDAMSFLGLMSLEELNINEMASLTVIFDGTFIPLEQLINLNCNHNPKLNGIGTRAFVNHFGQGATKLARISMMNNSLTFVNQETFAHFNLGQNVTLDLNYNKLHCDCHLQWLKANHGDLRCQTPIASQGKALKAVDFSQTPCPTLGQQPRQDWSAAIFVAILAVIAIVVGSVAYLVVRNRRNGVYPAWHYIRAKDNEAYDFDAK